MMLLTSLQNPRVKEILHLRKRTRREKGGHFLIEGFRELTRAVAGGVIIEELFVCPTLFLGENEGALIDSIAAKKAKLFEVTDPIFHKISYRDRPDGLLAIAKEMGTTLDMLATKLNKTPLLIIAEAIEKPGNLGTILRSADAAGADGVIVCDRGTDIHNPNVVRASVGTLFTIPVVETSSEEALRWLKERNILIAAATPSASLIYTDAPLNQPLALAMGTEQLGLSEFWMKQADIQVRIPMRGVADSLNVAMATTLLLFEAVRQRTS